ncbi:CRP-like cAMP-binding protein [Rhizobium sp. BK313]|uniref:Crp/Fnr family transcriptional regulator n=1 Tax=Rhizobium sp. BK313 TaxID=2587081 RepID=UPI0010DC0A14|nr:Crp/Fnr family transcriptional regulator [Rhizobium sp. BK313]MBB3458666.1 CRP-like cAMP-binding protein [Rhizobium sp. BK313]
MDDRLWSDNGLITLLPKTERRSFMERLERVYLPRGLQIAQAGKPLESVYFLSSGIGSVLAVSETGLKAEAGMFGREGFAPTASSVGANTNPYDIVIQVEGYAYRLSVVAFQEIVATSRAFSNLLSRYVYVFAAQVTYTALANAAFKIDQRLARWVLMCHDRLDTDNMPMVLTVSQRTSTWLCCKAPRVAMKSSGRKHQASVGPEPATRSGQLWQPPVNMQSLRASTKTAFRGVASSTGNLLGCLIDTLPEEGPPLHAPPPVARGLRWRLSIRFTNLVPSWEHFLAIVVGVCRDQS